MKAIKKAIQRKLDSLQSRIDKLEAERSRYEAVLELLDPKPEAKSEVVPAEHNPAEVKSEVKPKTMICLYQETHDNLNSSNQTFIPINKNPKFREILDDLIKNKVELGIYDDSMDEKGREILNSVNQYIEASK